MQATMEAVYLVVQTVLYVSILYFMAGFAKDAGKFFYFMLFSLETFLVSACHAAVGQPSPHM